MQTAGRSWALASLLLGQWKITKEARLPSAMRAGSPWARKTHGGTGNTPASTYLGRRGVWEAVGVGVAGAAGEGAGTGRCVDSCQSPWSRTSGARPVSPAEMGTCAQEKTVRPLGAELGPPHPLAARLELGLFPEARAGRIGRSGVGSEEISGRLAWRVWRLRFYFQLCQGPAMGPSQGPQYD